MEFSRPEYWSEWPFPSPGDLPNPGIKPRSPTLQGDSLPAEPPGKPKNTGVGSLSLLQGIYATQESNQGLLHYRQILYQLSCQESPYRELGPHLFSGFHSHWIISTKVLPACGFLVLPALNPILTQINPTSSLSLWIPKFELLSFGDKVLVHLNWGSPALAIFPSLWLKKKIFFIILPLSLCRTYWGNLQMPCDITQLGVLQK